MNTDEIDGALHEIEQMVLCALKAHDSLLGEGARPGFFHMPVEDANLLSFAAHDLLNRVRALRTNLYPPERVNAPILTLIPGGAS